MNLIGLRRRVGSVFECELNLAQENTCALHCPVFGSCGGCSKLDIAYDLQLAGKDLRIHELFDAVVARQGADAKAQDGGIFRPIIGMDEPTHYRNKITSPFVRERGKASRSSKGSRRGKQAARKGARILTGMYGSGTHKVVPNDGCALENEVGQRVIKAIVRIMQKHGIEPYDEDTGEGFLRHVIVRVGHQSEEVLVVPVINATEFPFAKSFCRELKKAVPEITSIVANTNLRQTNVILGERDQTLYGPGFILDDLCGLSFRISANSFYQVNAVQTEVLYDAAIALAELSNNDTLIDAYCGTGTIGLVAAKRSGCALVGFDSSKSAIRDAKLNAKHNDVKRAEFVCCDEDAFFAEFGARLAHAADEGDLVLMMDPPRSGATEKFLAQVAELAPQRIVYVSCNPQTQARDVGFLQEHGYLIDAIQSVDMFPHTDHIENIVAMTRATE